MNSHSPEIDLTEADLTDLQHVALLVYGNGHDGRDREESQDRVIAVVRRIVNEHVAPIAAQRDDYRERFHASSDAAADLLLPPE